MNNSGRNSIAVANYFIHKAAQNEEKISIMQLVKLVYIAHGWYLAFTDKPLIKDSVEAWTYGPVVPVVYEQFRPFGTHAINRRIADENGKAITENWSTEEVSLMDQVYDIYTRVSAFQLSEITNKPDTPWYIASNDGTQYWSKIDNKLIKQHYQKLKDVADKNSRN